MPQEQRRARALRGASARGARCAQGRGPQANLPGTLDDYYVPRGYAVVLGESIGTFNSQGCPDVGADAETLGTKAAIDWLNGRARGFDDARRRRSPPTGRTGDVGMVGTSYNGTLPNQVATTGVEGLKTIIPVSAISCWYDYYRANGLVVAPHSNTNGAGENGYLGEDTDVLGDFIGGPRMQDPSGECRFMHDYLLAQQDRVTGDYSPVLGRARLPRQGRPDPRERVRRPRPQRLQRQDEGVRRVVVPARRERRRRARSGCTTAATAARAAPARRLPDAAAPLVRPLPVRRAPTASTASRGRPCSARTAPTRNEADWPAPGTRNATLELGSRSRDGARARSSAKRAGAVQQSFVDRGRELDTDDVLIQAPDAANPNRLVYRTGAAVAATCA